MGGVDRLYLKLANKALLAELWTIFWRRQGYCVSNIYFLPSSHQSPQDQRNSEDYDINTTLLYQPRSDAPLQLTRLFVFPQLSELVWYIPQSNEKKTTRYTNSKSRCKTQSSWSFKVQTRNMRKSISVFHSIIFGIVFCTERSVFATRGFWEMRKWTWKEARAKIKDKLFSLSERMCEGKWDKICTYISSENSRYWGNTSAKPMKGESEKEKKTYIGYQWIYNKPQRPTIISLEKGKSDYRKDERTVKTCHQEWPIAEKKFFFNKKHIPTGITKLTLKQKSNRPPNVHFPRCKRMTENIIHIPNQEP